MDHMRQVFSVDVLERYAAKGQGDIKCMSAGYDVFVLGTSKGWLIRYNFGAGESYGIYFYLFSFSNFYLRFRSRTVC